MEGNEGKEGKKDGRKVIEGKGRKEGERRNKGYEKRR